jgi:hypothetical protein
MKKTYTISCTINENGKMDMSRTNKGFNVFELIGVLQFALNELTGLISGKIDIETVTRIVEIEKEEPK